MQVHRKYKNKVLKTKSQARKYFNFFGTSQGFNDENSSDYGVLQFKRNFNGNIEYFMDNYEVRNAIGKIWKI